MSQSGSESAAGEEAPAAPSPPVDPDGEGIQDIEFDSVDHLIELHGHIIGMCLSPDQRYVRLI